MSRFARNIHIGSHVQQGEVIGYVGMTGLATGPHLHYEYLMNGVHKDPQTVKLPGAEPLSADAMDRFHAETAPWLDALAAPQPQVQPSRARLRGPLPAAQRPVRRSGPAPSMRRSARRSRQLVGERRTRPRRTPSLPWVCSSA